MMLSRRGMPRLSQILAGYGRRGDSMLAHVTPAEANLLKRRGGSGTTNPVTGLQEFYTGARGGQGGPKDRGPGAIGGGMGGAGGAAGARGGLGGVARGGQGSPKGTGPSAAQREGMGIGGLGGSPGSRGAQGAPAGGLGSAVAAMNSAPVSVDMAAMRQAQAREGLNLGVGPAEGIGIAAGTPFGLGGLAGFIGSGVDALAGWGDISIGGQSITEARNAAYGSPGFGSAAGPEISRREGAGRNFRESGKAPFGNRPAAPPAAPGAPETPAAPSIPGWLRQIVGDDLSPIQLRSLIATQGSQGLESSYRDMETLDYYRQLLKSSVKDYAEVLPVEHRYLQDVYGFQYQPTLQDLYRVLG